MTSINVVCYRLLLKSSQINSSITKNLLIILTHTTLFLLYWIKTEMFNKNFLTSEIFLSSITLEQHKFFELFLSAKIYITNSYLYEILYNNTMLKLWIIWCKHILPLVLWKAKLRNMFYWCSVLDMI